MDARRTPVHPSRRRWAVRPWTLVGFGLLLMAGTLLQACSDNNGSTGPTFECRELTAPQATAKGTKGSGNVRSLAACTGSPAPSTGFANSSEDILIRVTANPASTEPGRRVTLTVLVTNGANGGGAGLPLAGKRVFVNTSTSTVAFGTVDSPSGITNANGIYQTTMIVRCSDAGIVSAAPPQNGEEPPAEGESLIVTVDAFVDGASSAANGTSATVTVTGTSSNPPCPGSA